ncbi:52bb9083-da87-4a05-81e2-c3b26ebec9d6 [Sclerotinia trifoliorum]|uniref:52bb9083-da87-4a05-81e2-c3b26ebec9d6 n=1 Tax=Sclerotinia trifoliorum TaxID=28548 RepID=A0A8H2ZNC8_9HELO|nr:52bb9083-da87-4a05-81e2-c3b26ebec9d6 [Sclerotinia trifoliorum]
MLIGMGATLIEGVRKHAIGYRTPPSSATTPEEVLSEIDPKTSIVEQVEYAVTLLMILTYGFIKCSIVLFYRRVFVVDNGSAFSILVWISFGIVVAWTITFFLLFLFLCGTHFSAAWGSRAGLIRYCSNSLKKEEGLYISEFLINILLVVMPMPMIWRLHMPLGRKLAVTGIFLLAFLALVASIIRLGIVISLTTESIATLHVDENRMLDVFLQSHIPNMQSPYPPYFIGAK